MKYAETVYALISVSSQEILHPIKFKIVVIHAAAWVQLPVKTWVTKSRS